MNGETWQKLESIFSDALALDFSARAKFLDSKCNGNEELRAELEAMLRANESMTESFLNGEGSRLVDRILMGSQRSLIGEMIGGRYRADRLIGEGAVGQVYLAHDTTLRRQVALKVFFTDLLDSSDTLERFEREAKIVAQLKHPNIVTVYDYGEDGDLRFISMEYLEGETLRDRLSNFPMEIPEAIVIAIQIAAALTCAHTHGVVHRDIKPENIMLESPRSTAKVLDFGIAKATRLAYQTVSADGSDPEIVKTARGVFLGTPCYMSPEQVRTLEVDRRTDTWSLGILLYEMVTRRLPFQGISHFDTAALINEARPAPLSEFRQGVPKRLQSIVSKALQKEAKDRYQSALEMQSDLEKLRKAGGANFLTDSSGLSRSYKITILLALSGLILMAVFWGALTIGKQRRESGLARNDGRSIDQASAYPITGTPIQSNPAPPPAPTITPSSSPEAAKRETRPASAYVSRARQLYSAAKYDSAIKWCDKALSLEPHNAEAHELRQRIVKTRAILSRP